MENPTKSRNIEYLEVRYDVVTISRGEPSISSATVWNKKLGCNHFRFMDRHRLCRTLSGRLTCTNRLAATFYSTFPVRPASRGTLHLTLGQIQSEAETLLRQANGSGIAGTSEGASQDITVRGWIKSLRRQKHVAFLNLSDGTESNLRKGFQVVIEEPPLLEAIKSYVRFHHIDVLD